MRVDLRADTVVVATPAKLNLFLEIQGKRADGYHELDSLFVAIDLFDNLEFRNDPAGRITLACDDPAVPAGTENLVIRAAELLRQHAGCEAGAAIHLAKRIPMGAGLGGGSSDAAASLAGLNRLWSVGLPAAELVKLAGKIGSDAAFFLNGRAAWCTGRGEIITPARLANPLDVVLVCPAVGLSTAAVYAAVRQPEGKPVSSVGMRNALASGSVDDIARQMFNRLQAPAEALCPEVRKLRTLFETIAPGRHLMTGSGSGYFALADHPEQARRWVEEVQRHFRGANSESPPQIFVLRTMPENSSSG